MSSNALARFNAAWRMARDGLHEEALAGFQWFHEHALEESRYLSGVRASYLLYEWLALGRVYPPALKALEQLRDRGTALLLAGQGNCALFSDVCAIHDVFGEPQRTHALYLALDERAPELARECAGRALTPIVAVGDYALAERLMPDPETSIRHHAHFLNDDFLYRRRLHFRGPVYVDTSIRLFVDHVREILTVLEGCGRRNEAARLRALSSDLIRATTIRRAVRALLLPGARPWDERGTHPRRKVRLS